MVSACPVLPCVTLIGLGPRSILPQSSWRLLENMCSRWERDLLACRNSFPTQSVILCQFQCAHTNVKCFLIISSNTQRISGIQKTAPCQAACPSRRPRRRCVCPPSSGHECRAAAGPCQRDPPSSVEQGILQGHVLGIFRPNTLCLNMMEKSCQGSYPIFSWCHPVKPLRSAHSWPLHVSVCVFLSREVPWLS